MKARAHRLPARPFSSSSSGTGRRLNGGLMALPLVIALASLANAPPSAAEDLTEADPLFDDFFDDDPMLVGGATTLKPSAVARPYIPPASMPPPIAGAAPFVPCP